MLLLLECKFVKFIVLVFRLVSLAAEIQKRVELKNQGILNDDEFSIQKQRLINYN
jgi:hypothetical protein